MVLVLCSSGFWTAWLMTTGGPCRSSSSVPTRSSDRQVTHTHTRLYLAHLVSLFHGTTLALALNHSHTHKLTHSFPHTHTHTPLTSCWGGVADVPEAVYPCDPAVAAGPRPPVPAAWHGGRVGPPPSPWSRPPLTPSALICFFIRRHWWQNYTKYFYIRNEKCPCKTKCERRHL